MSEEPGETESDGAGRGRWFLRGVRATAAVPVLILMSAFIGFAGLAKESGFTLAEALFMSAVIWALPAQVVLVGAVSSGATLGAAALAVTLSSIRLLPMTVAIIPEMRTATTPRWVLYGLSHFIAVTSWVMALQTLRSVPRPMRTTYYAGMGGTLVVGSLVMTLLVYMVAESLPPAASAALLLLTPMYFLTSLWGSAREQAGKLALVMGIALGPIFHIWMPGFDLLAVGIVGGGLAYAYHRVTAGRRTT